MTRTSYLLRRCVPALAVVLGLAAMVSEASAQPASPAATEPRVAVLMYHHLSTNATSNGTMTPALFRDHLETLRRLNLPVISLPQLAAFLDGLIDLPPEAVALTFDDGYQSFYNRVFPLLRDFNFPATVFVIVRPSERPETASPNLPHLSLGEMREMVASGLVTVAPHSYDQHRFVATAAGKQAPSLVSRAYLAGPQRGETVDEYETRVLADFAVANRILQDNLGYAPEFFAFPYGRYDSWLIRLARVAGYRFLFTTRPGVVTRSTDPLQIPRVNAGSQSVSGAVLEDLLRSALRGGR